MLPVALLAATLIGALWFNGPVAAPDRPVAVLFPPWWSEERTLGAAADAGGAVLGLGRLSGLVVTQSSDPGFPERLRAAGALILFDPRGFGLCTPSRERLR
ncbi:hypothetical protein [Methylorubrum zatmanii]|uniref:Alpha/beta hydrolase n=1 Tax=Methylorubrum zatmanii TaxID=29429 RepID=A0ABW1WUA8_9HYPH|nr:hypothetical protein [Methylorubrum zatmanii]MBD8906117.1 hypothetical protein [Methylorubrum zatmanii]